MHSVSAYPRCHERKEEVATSLTSEHDISARHVLMPKDVVNARIEDKSTFDPALSSSPYLLPILASEVTKYRYGESWFEAGAFILPRM